MLDNITETNTSINLFDLSDRGLSAIINGLDLKSSLDFLRNVKKFLVSENILPSEQIFEFFDAIYTSATSRIENIDIGKMFADDREIVRTFSDVYKKAEYLADETCGDLTICDILKISSQYLETLGIRSTETVKTAERRDLRIVNKNGNKLIDISFDNSCSLPYGYIDPKKQKTDSAGNSSFIPSGMQFVLISGEDKQYDTLCSEALFSENTVASAKIDARGVLYSILSLACGAVIDLSALSKDGSDTDLKDLVCAWHGDLMVAAAEDSCNIITDLAAKQGLTARKIAFTINEPLVKLNCSSSKINIRSGFLRRLFSYHVQVVPKIPAECFAPTQYEQIFYKESSDGAQKSFDKTLIANGHTVSALYTKQCSFTNAINTVLDTVFSLLAKGIHVRDIGITLKIGIKEQNIAGALASTLGAYRVIMELCLPQKNSEIIFSDEEFIFCSAYAKLGEKSRMISDSFSNPSSSNDVYLMSFNRFDNTTPPLMPDFDQLRRMCEFLHSMISCEKVISARAINGSVLTAAKNMCGKNAELTTVSVGGISDVTSAQGFVVEAKANSKLRAPVIGTLNAKTTIEAEQGNNIWIKRFL